MQCYLAKVTQLANSRISTKIQTAAIPNLMIFLHFQKKLISEEINLKKKHWKEIFLQLLWKHRREASGWRTFVSLVLSSTAKYFLKDFV